MDSKTDLQNLVSDLQVLWLVLKRRWRPASIVFTTILGLVILFTLTRKPVYEAKGKMLLEKSSTTSSLTASGRQIGELRAVYGNPIDTEAEKIRSLPLIQKTIATLQLKDEEGEPLKPEPMLKKKLFLDKIRGTDVLLLAYRSEDPREAAKVVNTLMTLYQESNVETDRAKATTARKFIANQLPRTEQAVKQAEQELRQFQERNNVADLEQEASIAVKASADLQQQISALRVQLQRSQAQFQTIGKLVQTNAKTAFELSQVSQTPGVQGTMAELQKLEEQLTIARSEYQDSHPKIAELESQVLHFKGLLGNRVQKLVGGNTPLPTGNWQSRGLQQELLADFVKLQVEVAGLSSQINGLTAERTSYQQRLQLIPRLVQEQRQLESKLNAARSTYEMLLKNLQEIRISENQNTGNAEIIEYAPVPDKFMLRPYALKLLLGMFLGGLAAIATIILLELRDKTLKTVKEVRDVFGYPLLGMIPTLAKSEAATRGDSESETLIPELIVRDLPRSPITEAYRMLQSNLKFLRSDQEIKQVVITSCTVGEGKSTVSANLAMAVAQREYRVLLIDADLRRPMQHHIWGLANGIGLSNLLVGEAETEAVIKPVQEHLHILTAGVTPPNPGALLDSQRMQQLLADFQERYDFVIIDTPSLGVADDPRILGKITDGILLVTRPGVTDSHTAQSAKALLSQLTPQILGLIVNGVTPDHEPHSYYYYIQEYGIQEAGITDADEHLAQAGTTALQVPLRDTGK